MAESFKRVKVHEEGQPSDPVTSENPLQGLELQVLKVWLQNSLDLRRLHQTPAGRPKVERAVRAAVDGAHEAELLYRGQGMPYEQATELTAPSMWTPPTMSTIRKSRLPMPAVKRRDTSASPTSVN